MLLAAFSLFVVTEAYDMQPSVDAELQKNKIKPFQYVVIIKTLITRVS